MSFKNIKMLILIFAVIFFTGCSKSDIKESENPVTDTPNKLDEEVEPTSDMSDIEQDSIKKSKGYSLPELEKKLIYNGYLESLHEAYWVVDQGKDIVPYLNKLLENKQKYSGGAFPFNVIWALAQIGGSDAEKVLNKHNRSRETALALEAINLRKQNPNYRVFIIRFYDLSKP